MKEIVNQILYNIKRHKRKIKYCTIALVLVLVFFYFNPLFVYVPDCENAQIICNQDDGTKYIETVSAEDTEIIKEIFKKDRKLYYDSPSCGFYGHSIRLGNQEFFPACDTCNTIQYKLKYFSVSEKEIDQIIEIMEKYGAKFPCV